MTTNRAERRNHQAADKPAGSNSDHSHRRRREPDQGGGDDSLPRRAARHRLSPEIIPLCAASGHYSSNSASG